MLIRNCLTERKNLTVVYPHETIQQVIQRMDNHLSLPCTDEDNRFLGFVSKRRIFEAFLAESKRGTSFDEFETWSVSICIDPSVATLQVDDPFEKTIDIIIRHPFVAIVDDDQLIGIVKRGDVNAVLSVAFANNIDSQRLLIGTAEVEGALERLFNVIHRLEINVITAIPFDAGPNSLNRRILLKVSKTEKFPQLIQQLEKSGFLIVQATP